jgi:hypothetical protein
MRPTPQNPMVGLRSKSSWKDESMAGPDVSILLPYSPDHSDIASLGEMAKSLGSPNNSASDFHVETTLPIGGRTIASEGGRPFVASFGMPMFQPGEAQSINANFGFVPISLVSVGAMCSREIDHRVLGEVAAHLAKHFGGIIDFHGVLDVSAEHRGKLAWIPYDVSGRTAFSHVGDLEFMRDWLSSPRFHMIK